MATDARKRGLKMQREKKKKAKQENERASHKSEEEK